MFDVVIITKITITTIIKLNKFMVLKVIMKFSLRLQFIELNLTKSSMVVNLVFPLVTSECQNSTEQTLNDH